MTAVLKSLPPPIDLSSPAAAQAALRSFWRLGEAWKIGVNEQATLLGVGRTTLYQWKQGKAGPLDRHVLERLSYLFGIFAALQILLPVPERADEWIRKPNAAPVFGGASALDRMLGGQVADLYVVRHYLDGPTRRPGLTFDAAAFIDRIPVTATVWRPSYRLIPSRYPAVGLYDRIADPADLDVVFAIEALTNPRIRDEIGQLQLVAPEERISGAGCTLIMAAFTHLNPEGSRFSDGSYGVYYAAQALETAVAEVSHHRAVFLARTGEASIDVDMRVILATVDAPLHDLRDLQGMESDEDSAVDLFLDRNRYDAPQALGAALRDARSWGVRFPSVRHPGGCCVGIFRPKALQPGKEGGHIGLHWDGQRISHWYEKRPLHPLP